MKRKNITMGEILFIDEHGAHVTKLGNERRRLLSMAWGGKELPDGLRLAARIPNAGKLVPITIDQADQDAFKFYFGEKQ